MKKLVLLLVLIGFIATPGNESDLFAQLERMAQIDKYIWEAPVFIKSHSMAEIRKLGKLIKESSKTVPNRHDPTKTTTFMTFEFDGLKLSGFVKNKKELVPITIEITSPNWKMYKDLNVGIKKEKVFEVLGKPSKTESNTITYSGETENIYFYITNGHVSKIHILYYAS